MIELPERIELPTADCLLANGIHPDIVRDRYHYILGTVRGLTDHHDRWRLGIAKDSYYATPLLTLRDDLKPVNWSSFPIVVDGVPMVIDVSDFVLVPEESAGHAHWLRFHFSAGMKPFKHLGSFPPMSFCDWAQYEQLQEEGLNTIKGPRILAANSLGSEWDSRHRRRLYLRGILHYHFDGRADFRWTRRSEFWRRAMDSCCYVHSAGSWENSLDRSPLELFGLGTCVICPTIHDYCGEEQPQPGEHYLACRNDFKDVPDLVNSCLDDIGMATDVGRRAWIFFQRNCTPLAIWSSVLRRLRHGAPWHRGLGVDCDVAKPSLQCECPA
jgi:hypothetical protein